MRRFRAYTTANGANRGRFAEELLSNTHEVYRQDGRALMTPVPTPVGRRRRCEERAESPRTPGEFTGFYRRKTVADYLGVMAPRIPLALELKSVHKDRWYTTQLTDHQSRFLDHWAAMGGLAYLLIVFMGTASPPLAAVAKWPDFLREIAKTGHQGHGFTLEMLTSDFTATAAVPTDGYIALDYLRAIRVVEGRVSMPPEAQRHAEPTAGAPASPRQGIPAHAGGTPE